jgi:capsule polysaccharide export protein KpsE/RkpR
MPRPKLACILFTIAITGCATTNDPRKGGFFGGIAGLNSGAYEARVQQRQNELNRQRNINQELREQSSELDNESRQRESELAAEKQRMSDLENNLTALQDDVDRLRARSEKQKKDIKVLKNKIKNARQKLSEQQASLDQLDRAGGAKADPDRYKVLEQERNRLADEYKKLLEYSRALSNAAK